RRASSSMVEVFLIMPGECGQPAGLAEIPCGFLASPAAVSLLTFRIEYVSDPAHGPALGWGTRRQGEAEKNAVGRARSARNGKKPLVAREREKRQKAVGRARVRETAKKNA